MCMLSRILLPVSFAHRLLPVPGGDGLGAGAVALLARGGTGLTGGRCGGRSDGGGARVAGRGGDDDCVALPLACGALLLRRRFLLLGPTTTPQLGDLRSTKEDAIEALVACIDLIWGRARARALDVRQR